MRAVILCNGERPSDGLLRSVVEGADLVACTDGAALWALEKGISVQLFVGDMDSLEDRSVLDRLDCEKELYQPEKDMTDGEIAARKVARMGADEIILLGATGRRLDHTLGNLGVLVACKQMGVNAILLDDMQEIHVTCTRLELAGKKGDILSIIPLGVNARVHMTRGLQYQLVGHSLELGSTLGVSNVFEGERAEIVMEHGWVAALKLRS